MESNINDDTIIAIIHTVSTPDRSVFIPTTVGYIICNTNGDDIHKYLLTENVS